MSTRNPVLLIALLLCIAAAVLLPPVAGDGEVTTTETTHMPGPVTAETTVPTPEPTPVPTTIPTRVPTTEPTTIRTTEPTTEPTTHPTFVTPETTVTRPTVVTPPTTEPIVTITVPTIEPTAVGGGKGYIDTYCNVDGASVYFDGSYQCTIAQGICTVGVSPTGTPVRTVSVSKSGYTSWSGPLSHMPANGEHVAVYATINPVTIPPTIPPIQYGSIYAQSNPTGAAIYLNGIFEGYAPLTINNLAPDSYSMKASLNGYTTNTQTMTVYAGQTITYYPTLQPSPQPPRNTGTVTVFSNPSGALIYVDGNYQGKTPQTVTLYPGSHSFRLTMSGYSDFTSTVYVNAGSNQNLNANLVPAVYGTVRITSVPGAKVFMDSNQQGIIPPDGSLSLGNIVSGNHLFKVTAPGYNDWMNTVYIVPNSVNPINAALTPVGSPVPSTGSFNIVSTPTGAEVYIDNLFKGYTPATLDNMAAGQHSILLKYTGYVDYSTTASVTAGQTTPLAISMQPAPTPTPASPLSPAIIITGLLAALAIGIVLRRE